MLEQLPDRISPSASGNLPPSIESLAFDLAAPRTNDILAVQVQGAADPDGDPITLQYEWFVNGVSVQTTSSSALTDALDLAEPGFGDKGDKVSVSVTPIDPYQTGVTVGRLLLVANTAPVAENNTYFASVNQVMVGLDLIQHAFDPDEDWLSTTVIDGPSHGTLTPFLDGTCDYEPFLDYAGLDSFTVIFSDGEASSDMVTISMTISESPIDDDTDSNSIDEGSPNGTVVGIKAHWTSPTNAAVTYSLTYSAGGRFSIDSNSGIVSAEFGDSVDFESSEGSYLIKVQASDGLISSPEASFLVGVNNVAPTNLSNINLGAIAVIEGANSGSLVGINMNATDPGGGGIVYALTDDSEGRFSIDAQTGVVAVADESLIDYASSGSSYSITVRASDSYSYSDTVTVSISVIGDSGFQANDDYYYDGNYSVDHDTGLLTISATAGILGNDIGTHGTSPTIVLLSSTEFGDLTLNSDGSFGYIPTVPRDSRPEVDSFTYQIGDGISFSNATVHLSLRDPYFTVANDPPGNNGEAVDGAARIHGPGRLPWTTGPWSTYGIFFISDNTATGDSWQIWWNGPIAWNQHSGITGWDAMIAILENIPDGSLRNIYLCGHGSDTEAVATSSGRGFRPASITNAQRDIIRRKLVPGGGIVLLGCGQASNQAVMFGLAGRLGVPVTATVGASSSANHSTGAWYRLDP